MVAKPQSRKKTMAPRRSPSQEHRFFGLGEILEGGGGGGGGHSSKDCDCSVEIPDGGKESWPSSSTGIPFLTFQSLSRAAERLCLYVRRCGSTSWMISVKLSSSL
jgi:hypothetical protein